MSRTFNDPQERYFEDFAAGDVINTRGRTLESADFTAFAGIVANYYPLHVDEEYGKGTRFGTRLGHGSLTLSIAVGLVGMSGYYGDAIVALKELRSMRATKPVLPGDTLKVRAVVTGCEQRNESDYGQLEVTYSVRNQDGEEVMLFEQVMLARRKPRIGSAPRSANAGSVT